MKKIFATVIFGLILIAAKAQKQDPKSPGFDFGISQTPDTSMKSLDTLPKPQGEQVAKPYERIILYLDSVTNLISYIGVVEPKDINTTPDETTSSDSLYARAKRWANRKFTGGVKPVFETDKKNLKLVINGWMPAYAYGNKYSKRNIGKYEFKMTVWFKEGRYKYQLTNFVHEGIKSNEGTVSRNYFEFYYTSPNNIKGYDTTLRFADKDINKLIGDFKKWLKDPIIIDEEEW